MGDDYAAGWNMEDMSYLHDEEERTWKEKWKDYFVNDGVKLIFILLYLLANLAIFLERFFYYKNGGSLVASQAFTALGYGVAIARGCASCIKLNCAFILLMVLRNFLSFLRGTWVNNFVPIDKNITFHKWIGWMIFGFAILHVIAHYVNFWNVSLIVDPTPFAALVARGFAIRSPNANAFTTLAGATGQIALLCLLLMISSAVERIRRSQFEVFWYVHHLFIIFYAMLLAHGMGQILEDATFWMWFVGPAALYLLERIIRMSRGSVQTIIHQVIQHPSDVIEIRLKRTDGKPFNYRSGQYYFLNSPYLSPLEWHPFTITSAPNGDPYLSFHIRKAGDWTGSLAKLLNPTGKIGLCLEDMMFAPNGAQLMRVDGGFGAASEEVFQYETVMLIGAGIGVTPFASILKNIQYQLMQADPNSANFTGGGGPPLKQPLLGRGRHQQGVSRIKRVHFYWVNRDKESFEWFSGLLTELERNNVCNFLEINVYLTSRVNKEADIKKLMNMEDEGHDQVTGLQTGTTYGRPPWDKIFLGMAEKYEGNTVGVFFCGPKILSQELARQCKTHTDSRSNTKFVFKKENF